MKIKMFFVVIVLFLMCFSVLGFTGCDSRANAPKIEARIVTNSFARISGFDIDGDGAVKESKDGKVTGDDLNADGVCDSSDLMIKKNTLLEGIEIEYVYNTDTGSKASKKWTTYKSFIDDGGKVSGFNLDRKAGTYQMTFSYLGVESDALTYEITETAS